MLKRNFLFLFMLGSLFSNPVIAMEITSNGGLSINSPDKNLWFRLGGRLHIDQTSFLGHANDKQADFPSGSNIRRAYLDFKGGIAKNWLYNLTLSFKDTTTLLRGAFLNYTGFENTNFELGQIGIPSGLENWGDYNDLFFLEPSLLTGAFFPEDDFGLGIYVDRNFLNFMTLAGAFYQPKQSITDNYGDPGRADRLAEALRLTFSPIHTNHLVYHVGLWARHQSLNNNTFFQGFSAVPEAQARNTGTLVNTGFLQARHYNLSGIEGAALWGPIMIQTEYLQARVKTCLNTHLNSDSKTLHFHSYYIQGAYVLTGESRNYDFPTGTFSRVKPTRKYGAWEMVARYSNLQLNDQVIQGGKEQNFSLGLNWYYSESIRLSSNYLHLIAHPTNRINTTQTLPPKRHLNVIAIRLQLTF